MKTILCIDEQQEVPFASSNAFEPAGYMFLRVSDEAMARKVGELFKIDFVVYSGKFSDAEIMSLIMPAAFCSDASSDRRPVPLSEIP